MQKKQEWFRSSQKYGLDRGSGKHIPEPNPGLKRAQDSGSATLPKTLLYTEIFSIKGIGNVCQFFSDEHFFQVLGNQNFEPRLYFVLVIVMKKSIFFAVYFE